jgi:RNA 3'-terminal phosphate cyclase
MATSELMISGKSCEGEFVPGFASQHLQTNLLIAHYRNSHVDSLAIGSSDLISYKPAQLKCGSRLAGLLAVTY